jgi:hypothetical protein
LGTGSSCTVGSCTARSATIFEPICALKTRAGRASTRRVSTLGAQLAARVDTRQAELGAELHAVADAVYALRNELQAQQAAHRDPFGVLAALLRDLRPSAVRVGHAVWAPKSVDAYLRATWRLTDPEIRAFKGVWRDAKLIAVERETFARKFTVKPGVVAYMFAVPMRVFDLFRVDAPLADGAALTDSEASGKA